MKDFLENTWKHRAHVVLALPAFLILLFIMYVPMAGLVMAFKSFDYTKGIWASPWNGLDNFKYLLASKTTFITMTRKHINVLRNLYSNRYFPQCSSGNCN